MSMTEEFRTALAAKFAEILPHLDERQRRLLLAAEAKSLGHGGIRTVARAAGTREATVSLGIAELKTGDAPLGRVRREGAGRKRASAADPGLRPALLALVEPGTRGDPMSPLRWTTKSTRNLATALTTQGHRISADTVAACSAKRVSACSRTSKHSKASRTPTEMHNSATSTTRSAPPSAPGNRS
ncbi:MAG: hypothetical protein QOE61_2392 [Micromonosporaceae bacterium]|nr:hypothetical protein [Micromonosporaceae bacterium]